MKELHHGAMVSIEQPKPKASRLPILHGLSHLPSQRGSIDDLHHSARQSYSGPKKKRYSWPNLGIPQMKESTSYRARWRGHRLKDGGAGASNFQW